MYLLTYSGVVWKGLTRNNFCYFGYGFQRSVHWTKNSLSTTVDQFKGCTLLPTILANDVALNFWVRTSELSQRQIGSIKPNLYLHLFSRWSKVLILIRIHLKFEIVLWGEVWVCDYYISFFQLSYESSSRSSRYRLIIRPAFLSASTRQNLKSRILLLISTFFFFSFPCWPPAHHAQFNGILSYYANTATLLLRPPSSIQLNLSPHPLPYRALSGQPRRPLPLVEIPEIAKFLNILFSAS